MQAAQSGGRPLDGVAYGVVVRHVGAKGEAARGSALRIEVEHRDARPAGEQLGGHGGPDTGRAPCHQGGQSLEIPCAGHRPVSPCVRRACQTGPCG